MPPSPLTPSKVVKRVSSPSPSAVVPVWKSISTPSKSSFSTKLTTPASASAPYTADAPPVIVSTRSMAADGIVFKSTISEAFTGCARRPSTSTSVRFAPMPRRFTLATPGVTGHRTLRSGESNCVLSGTNCGIWFSTLSMLIVLEFSSRCVSTVTIGLAASRSRRTMREPVTRISSSSCGSCALALVVLRIAEIVDARAVRLVHAARQSCRFMCCFPQVARINGGGKSSEPASDRLLPKSFCRSPQPTQRAK